jgi:hypothetical protein
VETILKITALKGQQSIAQGNALCSGIPHLPQALKGRNQEDVALSGLNKMWANFIRRAMPYAIDTALSGQILKFSQPSSILIF